MNVKKKAYKSLIFVAGFLMLIVIILVLSNPPLTNKNPKDEKTIKSIVKLISHK